jgi:hypothetical protein
LPLQPSQLLLVRGLLRQELGWLVLPEQELLVLRQELGWLVLPEQELLVLLELG